MTEPLKPCPFCGAPAMWCADDGNPANLDDPRAGGQWVQCSKCLCSTMMSWSLMDDCRPRLAEAWNRRVEPPPVAEVTSEYPKWGVKWLQHPKGIGAGTLLYAQAQGGT